MTDNDLMEQAKDVLIPIADEWLVPTQRAFDEVARAIAAFGADIRREVLPA